MEKDVRLSKNIMFGILGVFLIRGISLLTIPIITRIMPPEEYGLVAVYNVWIALFLSFVGLQVNSSLTNAAIDFDDDEYIKYQSSIMALAFISFAAISLAVVIFLAPLQKILHINKVLLLILTPHAFGIFCINFLCGSFIAKKKAFQNFIASLVFAIIFAFAAILGAFSKAHAPHMGYLIAGASSQILIGVSILIYIILKGKSSLNMAYWRYSLVITAPVILHVLCRFFLSQSDRILLQRFVPKLELGIYTYTSNICILFISIWDAFNTAFVPFYYGYLKSGDHAELLKRSKGFDQTITGLIIGFMLVLPELIKLISPQDYWGGFLFIPILLFSFYINHMYAFAVNFEYYHKKTVYIAVSSTVAGLVSVGLNLIIMPILGGMGAAIVSCIAYMVLFLAHNFIARRKIGNYPIPLKFHLFGTMLVVAAGIVYYLCLDMWIIRWILAFAAGIWILLGIVKRKSLI